MTMSRKLAETEEHLCDKDAVDDTSSSETMITEFISNPSKERQKAASM